MTTNQKPKNSQRPQFSGNNKSSGKKFFHRNHKHKRPSQDNEQKGAAYSNSRGKLTAHAHTQAAKPHDHRNGGYNNIDANLRKYDYMMDVYIAARRKYFEAFNKSEHDSQVKKAEQAYLNALHDIRKMERYFDHNTKRVFDKRSGRLRLDLEFSKNHLTAADNTAPDEVQEGHGFNFLDPHTLQSQKEVNFKEDTESSSGTIDDYKKIKP